MTTAVHKRVKESVIVLLFFLFYKTFCGSQCRSKLSLRSLALLLYKAGYTRQCHDKLSLRSLALLFYKSCSARKCHDKLYCVH